MATSKPLGKAGSARAKKVRNAATDGNSPGTHAEGSELADTPGAMLGGNHLFTDGAAHGGATDAHARDGLGRDGLGHDALGHDGAVRDGAVRDGRVPRGADGAGSREESLGRKPLKISTVSHTLDATVADRLRHFAFRERISESAVIEFALRELFSSTPEDVALGKRLREAGAALRRKT